MQGQILAEQYSTIRLLDTELRQPRILDEFGERAQWLIVIVRPMAPGRCMRSAYGYEEAHARKPKRPPSIAKSPCSARWLGRKMHGPFVQVQQTRPAVAYPRLRIVIAFGCRRATVLQLF